MRTARYAAHELAANSSVRRTAPPAPSTSRSTLSRSPPPPLPRALATAIESRARETLVRPPGRKASPSSPAHAAVPPLSSCCARRAHRAQLRLELAFEQRELVEAEGGDVVVVIGVVVDPHAARLGDGDRVARHPLLARVVVVVVVVRGRCRAPWRRRPSRAASSSWWCEAMPRPCVRDRDAVARHALLARAEGVDRLAVVVVVVLMVRREAQTARLGDRDAVARQLFACRRGAIALDCL